MVDEHFHCVKCGCVLDKPDEFHVCSNKLVEEKLTSINNDSQESLCLSCVNDWCPMNNDVNTVVKILNCSSFKKSECVSRCINRA